MTWVAILLYVVNAGPSGIAVGSFEIGKAFADLPTCTSFVTSAVATMSISQYAPSGLVTTGDLSPLKIICAPSQGL